MRSWLPSANAADTDFPVQNLPYGVFSHGSDAPRCGVAIGDRVLDLAALEADKLLPTGKTHVFSEPALNAFMELGSDVWAEVRARLTDLLREGGDGAVRQKEGRYLHPLSAVTLHLPFRVSEYTDFYAGKQHAFNVGTMFRGPENALPPNWLHIPIGYNGRASSVVVSGTDFHRPRGQLKTPDQGEPDFGPSKRLDIELEMGAVVGTGSHFGKPVTVAEADEMIFGYVLLNDWSARDIQAWEYQPLGPFQGKAFCTTISPWVVTKAALEPFRTQTPERERKLLPYLEEPGPMLYRIDLEVALTPAGATEETVISRTNYDTMYYSAAQQLAHHSSSGCPMRTGDLLGSGTISGETPDSYGSLLEMSWGGKTPLELPGGVTRSFLEDGDRVTLRGHAQGKGYRIGFGDCTGRVLPART
ncbi:MAG: fumarylacetoacetase [Nisaea sp.]|uniref:fumarylacetoacetase n=1 Tax=Nisaea sp. TaxID=2024842 RepID=UPI001B06DFF2|nr:fumarylacetoacetase [Nisaea sp.]MBO6561177.1 fumarylacetoacetase [Nisaea sp.]